MSHANVTVGQAVKDYFREFGKLRHASRKFWVVQLVNLLDGVAYFAMLPALTLYLSENLGFGDTAAGWWFGLLLGGIALASPVLILLLRKVIQKEAAPDI